MKISMMLDEISADPETAMELSCSWGVKAVEIRGIGMERYPFVSDFWKARLPELVAEFGVNVAALSPGLFKIPYPAPPHIDTRILRWEDALLYNRYQNSEALVRRHVEELLPATIRAAQQLGCKTIVCFSFDRGEGVSPEASVPQAVIDILRNAACQVEDAGLTLALEVEHICWGDTGQRTADLVSRVNHPALGINWDPANAYRGGEDFPYPEGYAAVQPFVRHVHFKDACIDPETGQRRFVFDGVVDWQGQINALYRDGYTGYITIETHAKPKVEMAHATLERLSKLIEEAQNAE